MDAISDLAFRFTYGRLSLALVGTLAERQSRRLERLRSSEDLARWCVEAGVADSAPPVHCADLAAARRLREAIFASVAARVAGKEPGSDDVKVINRMAANSTAVPRLAPTGDAVTWNAKHPLTAALSAIARDAIDLMTGDDIAKVKYCANPRCQAMFVDSSRPGRRRWCSMERCGNRAKQASRRSRARPG